MATATGFKRGSGFNREKFRIDKCAASITSDSPLEALSRYDLL